MNQSCQPTNLTASGQIVTGVGRAVCFVLTAGSDTATVTLYDNTAGSGTIVGKLSAVANTSVTLNIPGGFAFSTGIYATITGTSPSVTGYYIKG